MKDKMSERTNNDEGLLSLFFDASIHAVKAWSIEQTKSFSYRFSQVEGGKSSECDTILFSSDDYLCPLSFSHIR